MQPHRSAPEPVTAQPPELLEEVAWTVPETARRLGIKRSAAYAYVKSGLLPSIKLGGRLLVPREAVLALVDKALAEWGGPDAR